MSTMLIQSDTLTDIADSIRGKLGVQDTYLPSEMPDAIDSISGGGGTLGTKTITENGTYEARDDNLDGYSEVTVNVTTPGPTPVISPVDFDIPLFVLFQNDPADSVYTASEAMRVLVMNTMIIHEAGTTHDSDATITTTGTVINSITATTNFSQADATRDATTKIALIDLEANDTITMSNTSRTNYVSKHRIIWRADNVDDIVQVLYDTVIDGNRYNTRDFVYSNTDIYMYYLNQVSGANNDLSAQITINEGTSLDEYTANTTNNRIDAVILQNPGDITCTTNNAANYTSKLFEIMKIVPKGSGLGTKTIEANGTYNANDDGFLGYSEVTVNVPGGVSNMEAVRIWTKSTGGTDAALYIQHGTYNGSIFEGDSEIESLAYRDASVDTDYYDMISIQYNSQWICKSLIDGLVAGSSTYDTGDTIASWPYNASQDLIPHKPAANNILYGTESPDNTQGNNGDYYYVRRNDVTENGAKWTSYNDSGQLTAGWEFYPNTTIKIVGLRARNRYGTRNGYILLCDTSGNIIARTESMTFDALDGWKDIMLDTPVTLTQGTHYIVQVSFETAGGMSYQNNPNVTFSDKITYVQGRYGGTPGTTESTVLYSCDVIIGSPSIYYIIYGQYYKQNNAWYNILGSTYIQKDYIQFDADYSHRINLGLTINSDYIVQVDFDIDTYKSFNPILGNSSGASHLNLTQYDNMYYYFNGSTEQTMTRPLTGSHSVKFTDTEVLFDNTSMGPYTPYSAGNVYMWLGSRADDPNSGKSYNGKINRVIITSISTGEVVADFRPATEENVEGIVLRSGMYDFVRGIFIESALTVDNY